LVIGRIQSSNVEYERPVFETCTLRAAAAPEGASSAPGAFSYTDTGTTLAQLEVGKGGRYMAKYGKKASDKVEKAMHERKEGTLKSGRSGKNVTSKKQAIAIGLSEARKEGGKVPRKKSSSKKK